MIKFLRLNIRMRLTCIILITMMQFQSWHTHCAAGKLNPVCDAPECKKLGKLILQSMNTHGSPCSDFYDYVCRQWPTHNPRPQWKDSWTESHLTEEAALSHLRQLLEATDPTAMNIQNARSLFKACMKLPFLDKSDVKVIKEIMTNVGNWPIFFPKKAEITVPWSVIDDEYIKKTAESALFDLSLVTADNVNGPRSILPKLRKLISPYGTLTRYEGWGLMSKQKLRYKNSLFKIIEAVAPVNITPFTATIDKDLSNVISFREDLREMIKKISSGDYQVLTIKDFQEWYDKLAPKDETAKIDWLQKVRAAYKVPAESQGSNVTDKTLVFADKVYFSKLANLLKKTPKRVIANHIHLYFAERHFAFSSDVQTEIEKSFLNDFYTNGYIRYEKPRWIWCIEHHNMNLLLREMYIASAFPPTTKAAVEKLFVETKRLLNQQIQESTWMDDNMKQKAMSKITNMTSVIGYPLLMEFDTYDQYNETVVDPLRPDIYYSEPKNQLCASAASLNGPLYSLDMPYVIRYGSTIAVFGHEVYHAFNRNALKCNAYGDKWWPSGMRKKFKDQLKCFEDQYEIKRTQELQNIGIRNWGMLPDSTSEDVADVMGVKLAYKGYKEMFKKSNGTCPTLPGFENITCDQLFFITFAHSLCENHSQVGITRQLLTDVHSTARTRVNGIALNVEEFGTAFGCKHTDPLMLAKRCDVWK